MHVYVYVWVNMLIPLIWTAWKCLCFSKSDKAWTTSMFTVFFVLECFPTGFEHERVRVSSWFFFLACNVNVLLDSWTGQKNWIHEFRSFFFLGLYLFCVIIINLEICNVHNILELVKSNDFSSPAVHVFFANLGP